MTEGCLPSAAVGYEWDRPIHLLAEGQAAAPSGDLRGRDPGAAHRRRDCDVWERFGFAPIPAGPNGQQASVAGAMIFAVFRQAAHPKAAMRLIERAVTPAALAAAARRSGRAVPTLGAGPGRHRPAVSVARRGDHRAGRHAAVAPALLAGVDPAPGDARDGAHRRRRTGRRRPAHCSDDRRHHRAAVVEPAAAQGAEPAVGTVVRFEAPGRVALVDCADPPLRAGSVRIVTLYSGISAGTELTACTGTNPYTRKRWDAARRLYVDGDATHPYPLDGWGYEEVGRVVEVGAGVGGIAVDDLVYGVWGHRRARGQPPSGRRSGCFRWRPTP